MVEPVADFEVNAGFARCTTLQTELLHQLLVGGDLGKYFGDFTEFGFRIDAHVSTDHAVYDIETYIELICHFFVLQLIFKQNAAKLFLLHSNAEVAFTRRRVVVYEPI